MTSYPEESGQTSPAALGPETLNIVRTLAGPLTRITDDFVGWLYRDVVALSPNVAVSMAGGGWPFCERMGRLVLWVALTGEPPGEVIAVLRRVGADNWREGFPDSEYVSVAHALVRAVRGISESDWSTSMASAWISYFTWMRSYLLAGARQAAAEPPPSQVQPASPVDGEHAAAVGPEPDAAADADDEDDEVGYGQIMLSMTLNTRRER